MNTEPTTIRNDRTIVESLAEATATAGYAPSIHNNQPWRWRIGADSVDLYLQRGRVRLDTDPDARLATLSCGAALHHTRTVLAAEGWHVTVARMPDAADQEHLANVRVFAPATADPRAVRHMRTIPLRRTDRRPAIGAPVGTEDLRDIAAAVKAEGASLHLMHPNQVSELIAAAGIAQGAGAGDPRWRADLEYWTGDGHLDASGTPEAPNAPEFRQRDDLVSSAGHDKAARFAILHGGSDEPRDWLRAGEALSAAWLTATERGVSVLPISAPVEVLGTRDAMRHILAYLSHPFLVIRLAIVGPIDQAGGEPRLAAPQTIEGQ